MKITKELLLSIILNFFNVKKEISFYELEKKTGKDIKSLQAWSTQKTRRVQPRNFNAVVTALQSEISLHFDDFSGKRHTAAQQQNAVERVSE